MKVEVINMKQTKTGLKEEDSLMSASDTSVEFQTEYDISVFKKMEKEKKKLLPTLSPKIVFVWQSYVLEKYNVLFIFKMIF